MGKAPGIDNIYNIILKKAIGKEFYKVLARAFTILLKLGFIPHVWKVAVLCMLIKPEVVMYYTPGHLCPGCVVDHYSQFYGLEKGG